MPPRHPNLNESLVERLRNMILERQLKPGDRLPTEKELAALFGVSRISLREATKALCMLGIIKAAPRRGLTVGSLDMRRLNQMIGFQLCIDRAPNPESLKARQIIEIGSLQYLMETMQQDERVLLTLLELTEPRAHLGVDAFIERDHAFHAALLRHSRCEPLCSFSEVLLLLFKSQPDNVLKHRERWQASATEHRQIVEALHDRNLNLAQGILRKHLEQYGGFL